MIGLVCLLITLLILFVIAYRISNGDFLSPSSMLCISYIISTFFAVLGNRRWGANVSAESVIVIVCGIVFFMIGSLFTSKNRKAVMVQNTNVKSSELLEQPIYIRHSIMICLIIAELVALYIYYRKLVSLATRIGYSGTMLIQYVRVSIALLGENVGGTVAVISGIITPSTYLSIYIIVNNLLNKQKGFYKYYFWQIISVIIGFIYILLGGAREGMIVMLYGAFFVLVFNAKNRNSNKMPVKLILRYIVAFMLILYFLFTFMGTFTGKTVVGEEVNNFYMYAGGGIPAFSEWFSYGERGLENFGKLSFYGLYSLIDKVLPGISNSLPAGINLVTFPDGTKTNVFTCFKAYIFEYGIIGTYFMMALLGGVYTHFYHVIRKNKSIFRILLYTYFSRDIVYMIFTAAPTTTLLSVTQILNIMWLMILGRMLFGSYFYAVKENDK